MRPIVVARHLVAMLAVSSATPNVLFSPSPVDLEAAFVYLLAPIGMAAVFAALAWLFFTENMKDSGMSRAITLAWVLAVLLFLGQWDATEFGRVASMVVAAAAIAYCLWRFAVAYWDR